MAGMTAEKARGLNVIRAQVDADPRVRAAFDAKEAFWASEVGKRVLVARTREAFDALPGKERDAMEAFLANYYYTRKLVEVELGHGSHLQPPRILVGV